MDIFGMLYNKAESVRNAAEAARNAAEAIRAEFYNGFNSQLADNAISPDDYSGTDAEKVQSAVNYAISNKKSIRFARVYDITGHSAIVFNKPNTDRTVLYLIGLGGGIRRDDAGYMFTGSDVDMGDIYSIGMRYIGNSLETTYVWDCNKLIRVTSVADCFVKTNVLEADTRFAQSLKFTQFTCTGNGGWAFSLHHSFDVVIDGLIEHGANGIRNSAYEGAENVNLKIYGCIEGMSGKAILLSTCIASEVSAYFEHNLGGYIDLSNNINSHKGLCIHGCSFVMESSQISAHEKAIKWGRLTTNGASSIGNFAYSCDLHEIHPDYGTLTSIGDYAGGLFASLTGAPTVLSTKKVIDVGNYHDKNYLWYKNLLINSNFASSSNWTAVDAGTPVVASNVITFTPTAQYGYILQSSSCLADRKYFFSAIVDGSSSAQIVLSDNLNFTQTVTHSASAGYEFLSKLITTPSNAASTMDFQARSIASSGWGEIKVKYVSVLDVTAMFGAGKEPTEAEVAELFSGFENQWLGNEGHLTATEYMMAVINVLKLA